MSFEIEAYDIERWFDGVTAAINAIDPSVLAGINIDRARAELATSGMWREQLDLNDPPAKVVGQRDSS